MGSIMAFQFSIHASEILNDVKIISPSVHRERRGEIWTSFTEENVGVLLPHGLQFKHDKFSHSFRNVLRGLHGDNKSWKLVSCINGEILQVVADMRATSSTYLKWEAFDLGPSKNSILIPPGMGNAFLVKSDVATYHYKLAYHGQYIDADDQFTVSWADPRLNITWPIENPILSERDAK